MKDLCNFPTNHQNNCNDIKPYKNTPVFFSRVCLLLGAGLFLLVFERWVMNGDLRYYRNVWDSPGDFIAEMVVTLLAIAGFIYFYPRFRKDRFTIPARQLKDDIRGGGFFELVRLNLAHVAKQDLNYNDIVTKDGNRLQYPVNESRETLYCQVFQAIKKQFLDIEAELGYLFTDSKMQNIYEPAYLKKIEDNAIYNEQGVCPALLAKTDLLYLIVFFGVGSESQNAIYDLTKGHYRKEFLKQFLTVASKINEKAKSIKNDSVSP